MNPRKLPRGIAGWSSVSLFYAHSAIDMAAIDMTNLVRSAGPGPKRDVGGGGGLFGIRLRPWFGKIECDCSITGWTI